MKIIFQIIASIFVIGAGLLTFKELTDNNSFRIIILILFAIFFELKAFQYKE